MMNNKQEFEMPTAEIVMFETEDVITTSGGAFTGEEDVDLPIIDF